jgi:hypothetical protein
MSFVNADIRSQKWPDVFYTLFDRKILYTQVQRYQVILPLYQTGTGYTPGLYITPSIKRQAHRTYLENFCSAPLEHGL